MNTPSTLAQLSESELLEHFETLVACDRRGTAQLLVAIAEIDERKLWARYACPSMFVFCVERFHMSEQVTAKRIWAARTARRFPVVLEMVERGELHLSAIHLLSRHLTPQNCSDVLRRARHKSSREIERLVAELSPRPDVTSKVRALPRRVVDTAPAGGAAVASGGTTTRSEAASAPAVTMRRRRDAAAFRAECRVTWRDQAARSAGLPEMAHRGQRTLRSGLHRLAEPAYALGNAAKSPLPLDHDLALLHKGFPRRPTSEMTHTIPR